MPRVAAATTTTVFLTDCTVSVSTILDDDNNGMLIVTYLTLRSSAGTVWCVPLALSLTRVNSASVISLSVWDFSQAILTPFCSLDNTEFASPRWINSGFWVEHSLFLLVNLCKSLLLAIAFGSLTRLLAVIETVLFSYATMHEKFICFFFSHQLGLRGVANPFAIGRNRQ